jgi:hypothetical protein
MNAADESLALLLHNYETLGLNHGSRSAILTDISHDFHQLLQPNAGTIS